MNEADRRRLSSKGKPFEQDLSRPTRSANASPVSIGQINIFKMGEKEQNEEDGQTKQNKYNSMRPATGHQVGKNHYKLLKNSGSPDLTSVGEKISQRPKTSSKLESNGGSSIQHKQQATTTASTTTKRTTEQTKSLGEDSVKRIIKKSKTKSNSRPSSANKKKVQTQTEMKTYQGIDQQKKLNQ